MKVKALLEQLKAYDGEDELIVAYWDKNIINLYGAPDLTDEEWGHVVWRYEDGEWGWQSHAAETFVEIAQEVRKETKENGSEE
jgi:hypothetical protein